MSFACLVAIFTLLGAVGMINAVPVIPQDGTNNNLIVDTSAAPAATAATFNYSCTQPALSSKPEEWSKQHFIVENLPDPITPTPVFWSGRLNNSGSLLQAAAEKCAANRTGATIGQLMSNSAQNFTMPSPDAPQDLWVYASQVLAYYTGRTAYVVVGDAIVTSTWFNTEWPTLKENPKVEAVIGLYPNNCTDHCFWKCTNNATECSSLRGCTLQADE